MDGSNALFSGLPAPTGQPDAVSVHSQMNAPARQLETSATAPSGYPPKVSAIRRFGAWLLAGRPVWPIFLLLLAWWTYESYLLTLPEYAFRLERRAGTARNVLGSILLVRIVQFLLQSNRPVAWSYVTQRIYEGWFVVYDGHWSVKLGWS